MASSAVFTEVLVSDLPATAPANKQIMYIDSVDSLLKVRNDLGIDRSLVAGDLNINNFQLIQSASDWVNYTVDLGGGVRQMLLNTTYQVVGSISRSFTLEINGINTIIGFNPSVDIDLYTGTGDSFRDAAAFNGLTIMRCASKGVAGSGSRFLSQTNGGLIINVDTSFIEYDNLGTTDAIIVLALRCAFGSVAIPVLAGFVITSINTPTISFDNCAMRLSPSLVVTGVDFTTATSVSSILIGIAFSGGGAVGSIGVKGAPNSANLIGTARGIITRCNFSTVNTPLSGITINDLKWQIFTNRGIQETRPDAFASSVAGGTTTIAIAGTPVKLNAVFVDIGSSQFTVDSTGRITYIGLDPFPVPIDVGLSMQPTAGTNKVLFIEIAKNGVPLELTGERYTKSGVRADNSDPLYVSTFAQPILSTNDYIEIFVGNTTDTTSVITSNVKLRIN